MSRIKTESFLQDVRDRVDEFCLSVPEIEAASGIHNSVLYRILEGSRKTVDRATLRRLADALDMDYKVKGDWAKLTKRGSVEAVNHHGDRESLQGQVGELMKTMSFAHLEAVNKFARIIATMDDEEIIDFMQACDALDMGKNKEIFLEKLKAFAKIVMPYEAVKKDEWVEQT